MTPNQFKKQLEQTSRQLKRKIEAEVSRFSPGKSVERRDQAMTDFHFFCQTYFPHYLEHQPSVMHRWLFEHLPVAIESNTGVKLALAAPRGEAKSTLVTQLFTLWCLLTERKRFAVIIMDSYEQAAAMLEAIKVELEVNPRLLMDWPEATGIGRKWREGDIVLKHGARISAAGSGQRLRGLRDGPTRPDLTILDDIENDENVRSRKQRDKLDAWLRKAVLKLGPADDSMDVVFIGTVLHHDSVLSRALNNSFWNRARFRGIITWPQRMDLWEQWEKIYHDQAPEDATAFLNDNRAEMTHGAEVSWPDGRPLETLMLIRARDGHDSFDSEIQNNPIAAHALFSTIPYWKEENPDWVYFGAVDPSLGRSGHRGDPSAILVGGYDRRTGKLDIVVADIARRKPDQIIQAVIDYQRQYQCQSWIVETVQFQQFFKDELVRQSINAKVPVPARGVKPSADKELRITSLQPHLTNGLIRIHSSQTTLLEQLRHYGESDTHDDGPDALHMLWSSVSSGVGSGGGRYIPIPKRSPFGGVARNGINWRS